MIGLKNLEVSRVSKVLCLDMRVRERVLLRMTVTFFIWMFGWMEVLFIEMGENRRKYRIYLKRFFLEFFLFAVFLGYDLDLEV